MSKSPEPKTSRVSASNELLQLAQEAGRLGVFEWHVQTGVLHLSPQFLSLYGVSDFDGRYESWLKYTYREDVARVDDIVERAFAERARETIAEFRIVRASDKSLAWIEARSIIFYDGDGHPVRVVGVNVDITERKRSLAQMRAFTESLEDAVKERTRELEAQNEARQKAEELLRQAQKMEAVGQLTGGIAHDFNNMLAVIIGGLNLIERRLAKGEDTKKFIDAAMEAAKRAATLTQRLLAFSRQLPLAPEPIDANRMVSDMSEMLKRTIGEATPLETVLAGGLWKTHADASQLENAILNLAINGRDAMPNGGKLTIETANCHLDDEYARKHGEVRAGQYVMVAVSDNGTGMAPDVVAKAFDPFFTTKDVGKGTGLGLSQVYGFVKQSQGHIKIYSEVGQGTVVKIYLPRLVAPRERQAAGEHRAPTPVGTSNEVILVVEDEDRMREISCAGLRELGYTVVSAPSASRALQILETHPQVTVLFTDVVMPDMNGRKLADVAMKMHPKLKVLFTTGYTRNAVVHEGVLDAGVNFLAKPFTLDQLGQKLREVISSD